jgi:hypothetical protein
MVNALCNKPEVRGFDTRRGEFLNLPNPSGRTRPWGFHNLYLAISFHLTYIKVIPILITYVFTLRPLSLVSTIEELLVRKSNCSGLQNREYGRRRYVTLFKRHHLYPQKLALTTPTSICRSEGIVLSQTQATVYFYVCTLIFPLSFLGVLRFLPLMSNLYYARRVQ